MVWKRFISFVAWKVSSDLNYLIYEISMWSLCGVTKIAYIKRLIQMLKRTGRYYGTWFMFARYNEFFLFFIKKLSLEPTCEKRWNTARWFSVLKPPINKQPNCSAFCRAHTLARIFSDDDALQQGILLSCLNWWLK